MATAAMTAIRTADTTYSCQVIGPSRLLISLILGVSGTSAEATLFPAAFNPTHIRHITRNNPSNVPATGEKKNAIITKPFLLPNELNPEHHCRCDIQFDGEVTRHLQGGLRLAGNIVTDT